MTELNLFFINYPEAVWKMNCGLGGGAGSKSEEKETVYCESNSLIKKCSLTRCRGIYRKEGNRACPVGTLSGWYIVQSAKGTLSMRHFTFFFKKIIKIY